MVSHDAHLQAYNGDLILDSTFPDATIHVDSPSSFITNENMHIYKELIITRNTNESVFTLQAKQQFRCSTNISLFSYDIIPVAIDVGTEDTFVYHENATLAGHWNVDNENRLVEDSDYGAGTYCTDNTYGKYI